MPTYPEPITLAHRVRRSDQVLFQEIEGEAVLLDLAGEVYFGLNAVGTRIWALLGETEHVQTLFDAICAEYDAAPDLIRSDLVTLLRQLAEAGLVRIE